MTEQIVILSTCASDEEARQIALLLLDRGLAACVNVIPACESYFHWQGKIDHGKECLLLIKSSRSMFANVASAIEAAHSYEVPEVIALPIIDGAANYLNWLSSNLRAPAGDES